MFLANICTQKFTPFLFAKSKQCHWTYHTCLAKIWLIKLLPSFMTKSQILFCSSLTRVVIKLNVMFNFVKKYQSLGRNLNTYGTFFSGIKNQTLTASRHNFKFWTECAQLIKTLNYCFFLKLIWLKRCQSVIIDYFEEVECKIYMGVDPIQKFGR